jgi:hypothetical protein
MPRYRVELYNVYQEAFEVEAPTASQAKQLAYDYEYVMGMPRAGELEAFAGKVAHVTRNAYQYEEDPEVFAITSEGELIPLGQGDDPEDDETPTPERTDV